MWKTETVLVHSARITQSSLGVPLSVSWERFIGTALERRSGRRPRRTSVRRIHFGVSIFLFGLLCAVTKSDRSAYRFGAIVATIVLLVPRTG